MRTKREPHTVLSMSGSGVSGLPPPGPPPPPPPPAPATARPGTPWWKRTWVIIVAVVAAVVIGLAAIGSLVGPSDQDGEDATASDPPPTTAAATVATAAPTDPAATTAVTTASTAAPTSTDVIFEVQVEIGDCVESIPENSEIRAVVEAISCDEEHIAETHAQEDLPTEGPYPGTQALDDAASPVCEARFLDYVGHPSLQTPFDVTWFVPIEAAWEVGDREVTCMVLLPVSGVGSVQQIDLSNGWNGYHSVLAVQPGQCFDEVPDLTPGVIRLVDCAGPHAFETIGRTTRDDASYPGDVLEAEANAFCRQQFEAYVGASYDASPLQMTYQYPTAETWELGDRTVACFIQANGSVGSVAGTGTGDG